VLVVAGLAQAAVLVLLAGRAIVLGSRSGFHYVYVRPVNLPAVALGLGAGAALAVIALLGCLLVARRQYVTVLLVTLAGGGVAAALRGIATAGLSASVDSPASNDFYFTAKNLDAREYLADFERLARDQPTHTRANMPGKVLLYRGLLQLTSSPTVIALILCFVAAVLGGFLMYYLARELLGSRVLAIGACLLYEIMPNRAVMQPLLNTLTPLFALALLCIAVRYFDRRAPGWLILAGIVVYATTLFEPTALACGVVALFLLVSSAVRRPFTLDDCVQMVAIPVAAFVACHLLMFVVFDFDVFSALSYVFRDAREFNRGVLIFGQRANARPYGAYLIPNVREILVMSGPLVSLLAVGSGLAGMWGLARDHVSRLRVARDPVAMFSIGVTIMLISLVAFGVTRGEVTRVWIFLTVLFPIAAVVALSRAAWRATIVLAVGALALQVAIGERVLEFVTGHVRNFCNNPFDPEGAPCTPPINVPIAVFDTVLIVAVIATAVAIAMLQARGEFRAPESLRGDRSPEVASRPWRRRSPASSRSTTT
jgi:hypothetical protein